MGCSQSSIASSTPQLQPKAKNLHTAAEAPPLPSSTFLPLTVAAVPPPHGQTTPPPPSSPPSSPPLSSPPLSTPPLSTPPLSTPPPLKTHGQNGGTAQAEAAAASPPFRATAENQQQPEERAVATGLKAEEAIDGEEEVCMGRNGEAWAVRDDVVQLQQVEEELEGANRYRDAAADSVRNPAAERLMRGALDRRSCLATTAGGSRDREAVASMATASAAANGGSSTQSCGWLSHDHHPWWSVRGVFQRLAARARTVGGLHATQAQQQQQEQQAQQWTRRSSNASSRQLGQAQRQQPLRKRSVGEGAEVVRDLKMVSTASAAAAAATAAAVQGGAAVRGRVALACSNKKKTAGVGAAATAAVGVVEDGMEGRGLPMVERSSRKGTGFSSSKDVQDNNLHSVKVLFNDRNGQKHKVSLASGSSSQQQRQLVQQQHPRCSVRGDGHNFTRQHAATTAATPYVASASAKAAAAAAHKEKKLKYSLARPKNHSQTSSECSSDSMLSEKILPPNCRIKDPESFFLSLRHQPLYSSRIKLNVRLEDYYEVTNHILGTGISGAVRKAREKQSGRWVAVKTLRLPTVSEKKCVLLYNEVAVYLQLDHPNICKLLQIFIDTKTSSPTNKTTHQKYLTRESLPVVATSAAAAAAAQSVRHGSVRGGAGAGVSDGGVSDGGVSDGGVSGANDVVNDGDVSGANDGVSDGGVSGANDGVSSGIGGGGDVSGGNHGGRGVRGGDFGGNGGCSVGGGVAAGSGEKGMDGCGGGGGGGGQRGQGADYKGRFTGDKRCHNGAHVDIACCGGVDGNGRGSGREHFAAANGVKKVKERGTGCRVEGNDCGVRNPGMSSPSKNRACPSAAGTVNAANATTITPLAEPANTASSRASSAATAVEKAAKNDSGEEDRRECIHLVMELCTGKELYDRLAQKKRYDERDAARVTKQMLAAINYCHQRHICHRDLKLENWVYRDEGDDAPLKLIDFGFSRIFSEGVFMSAMHGTVYYVAPEVMDGQYDEKCDIWSIGVIVYMLLSGSPPFTGRTDQDTLLKIRRCVYSIEGVRWQGISEDAKSFVTSLLKRKPSQRPSAEQALAHRWLRAATDEESKVSEIDIQVLKSMQQFAAYSAFKRAALGLIAMSMHSSQVDDLERLFRRLDNDNSGTIKVERLVSLLVNLLGIPREEALRIFRCVDQTGDQEINYSEFLAATIQARMEFNMQLIREAFERFDVDKSGTISVENLRYVLGDTYDSLSVEEILKQYDLRKNGVIEFDEFLVAFTGQESWLNFGVCKEKADQTELLARQMEWSSHRRVVKDATATKAVAANSALLTSQEKDETARPTHQTTCVGTEQPQPVMVESSEKAASPLSRALETPSKIVPPERVPIVSHEEKFTEVSPEKATGVGVVEEKAAAAGGGGVVEKAPAAGSEGEKREGFWEEGRNGTENRGRGEGVGGGNGAAVDEEKVATTTAQEEALKKSSSAVIITNRTQHSECALSSTPARIPFSLGRQETTTKDVAAAEKALDELLGLPVSAEEEEESKALPLPQHISSSARNSSSCSSSCNRFSTSNRENNTTRLSPPPVGDCCVVGAVPVGVGGTDDVDDWPGLAQRQSGEEEVSKKVLLKKKTKSAQESVPGLEAREALSDAVQRGSPLLQLAQHEPLQVLEKEVKKQLQQRHRNNNNRVEDRFPESADKASFLSYFAAKPSAATSPVFTAATAVQ